MLKRTQRPSLQFDANGAAELTSRSPKYFRSRPNWNEADREWQDPQITDQGTQLSPAIWIGTDHNFFHVRAANALDYSSDDAFAMTGICSRSCKGETLPHAEAEP